MKLVWSETKAGRTSLAIVPEHEGETAPFPRELLLDTRLDARPPDRLWVAAALCFGPKLAGSWSGDAPVSTRVKSAISEYLGPEVHFNPVVSDDSYQSYPGGGTARIVPVSGSTACRPDDKEDATFVFELRELGDWTGRLYSIDRLVTASNAFIHAAAPGASSTVGPYLAAALLLATELHMDRLALDRSSFDGTDPKWWDRAARLCATVGIDLQPFSFRPTSES